MTRPSVAGSQEFLPLSMHADGGAAAGLGSRAEVTAVLVVVRCGVGLGQKVGGIVLVEMWVLLVVVGL
ncbi:hypothetical protein G205_22446 [Arthrobacter nitrophenolicus]|uniref:Uncharacterized protein n=1 Tax=Arthrobacter nitrophenolicus TaxID=683150 RepID=L8THE7_9MICC|nr:hypothetical protein G205_22446 [Arthrobacter nitrophenolicus]